MACRNASDFTFNKINTTISDTYADFRDVLTAYFHEYKIQKVTNHIHESFYQTVMEFAVKRPFNWLQPRSGIVKGIKQKETAQLFFFDALGVEYLGYIIAKCKRLGLIVEAHIGHAVLPSITSANKEFLPMFAKPQKDIKDLDELKHHSKVFDYERRHEPIYLFSELQIIDDELERIHSQLVQGDFERAVICSDHGASRLAVIAEKLNDSPIEMEEKGEHSGRCCPVAEDPKLPYVAYENGYAVLADYERFKGSRRANVEVHGGATLEEVVVPILTGRFLVSIFAALAQLEREQILIRQQEGVKAQKAAGTYTGGRPRIKIDQRQFNTVVSHWHSGEITAIQAMNELSIKKSTFYRLVKQT